MNTVEYTVGEKVYLGDIFSRSIHIPMFQRDYAQGRADKGYIRRSFLKEIKDCLSDSNIELPEDYIYGYKDSDEVFFPLDGQQRITTLWLVYWYLALRAEKLQEEKEYLKRFSYETRKSSREFCEAICNLKGFTEKVGLVEHIKKQTWFYKSWTKDPTISSMLRMIGGTNNKDGIEPILGDLCTENNDWVKKLDGLKNGVFFYKLELDEIIMPKETAERLYVKMNARGKALNDFENFKADFVDHMSKKSLVDGLSSDGTRSFDIISEKMDNEWRDVFWKAINAGQKDGKIDELFLALIHRMCLSELVSTKEGGVHKLKEELIKVLNDIYEMDDNGNEMKSDKQVKKTIEKSSTEERDVAKIYDYLRKDTEISYEEYLPYEKILNDNFIKKLSRIMGALQNDRDEIDSIIHKYYYEWESIIPAYEYDKKGNKLIREDKSGNKVGVVRKLELKPRAYFCAACKYLERRDFDKKIFEEWIRVSRNIIERRGVDSEGAMVSLVRKLDELCELSSSCSIIDYLKTQGQDNSAENAMDKQINEERYKAKWLPGKESEIFEAEEIDNMNGNIGFLLVDEKGNFDDTNFPSFFDIKKKNWEDYLNYLKTDEESFVEQFVRPYVRMFVDFEEAKNIMMFHTVIRQHRGERWIDVLFEDEPKRVHDILMKQAVDKKDESIEESKRFHAFVESESFKKIVLSKEKKDLRISRKNDRWALYKKSARSEVLYFDENTFKRNALLNEINKNGTVEIDKEHIVEPNEPYFWGEDIFFTIKNINGDRRYAWKIDDSIYSVSNDTIGSKKLEKASSYNASALYNEINKL